MSLISKILEHSRNARVPRARDPDTHEAVPYGTDAPLAVRVGASILRTSWANRFVLKWISALSGFISTWLIAKGAGEHAQGIALGVAAGLTFLFEQVASFLNSKATMKIPPHVGGQGFAPSRKDPLPLPVRVARENARRDRAALAPEPAEFRARLRASNPAGVVPSEAEPQEPMGKPERVSVSWKDAKGSLHEQWCDSLPEAITLRTHLRDTIDPFAKLK